MNCLKIKFLTLSKIKTSQKVEQRKTEIKLAIILNIYLKTLKHAIKIILNITDGNFDFLFLFKNFFI